MDSNSVDQIVKDIEFIKKQLNEKMVTKLGLDQYIRIAKRLDDHANECEECVNFLEDLERHFRDLQHRINDLNKEDYQRHHKQTNNIKNHLQKKHGLVPENHYMTLYMSVGISLGVALGMLLFDNLALGIPIGMTLGIAIGSGMDSDAKKKGKMI
ncbi:hypothetical protein [Piscibacillus salipiscarius]|uniref:Glycine zipper-like domain-containing protein n=1 Tax=Piscibacillus salipiscarius TaxID=299480 RepID=A0ABW5QCA3_9BACI